MEFEIAIERTFHQRGIAAKADSPGRRQDEPTVTDRLLPDIYQATSNTGR